MTALGIFLFPTSIRCALFPDVPEIAPHRIYRVKPGRGNFLLFFFRLSLSEQQQGNSS